MNNQQPKSRPQPGWVRVHVPPRSLDQRRLHRSEGFGPAGRPTARGLGISPRDLVRRHGLSMAQAVIASRELLERAHQELAELERQERQEQLVHDG